MVNGVDYYSYRDDWGDNVTRTINRYLESLRDKEPTEHRRDKRPLSKARGVNLRLMEINGPYRVCVDCWGKLPGWTVSKSWRRMCVPCIAFTRNKMGMNEWLVQVGLRGKHNRRLENYGIKLVQGSGGGGNFPEANRGRPRGLLSFIHSERDDPE